MLEVGVGTGIVADALRVQAPQVDRLIGIDISAQMLALAGRRLPGRLVRCSAQHLPFPDQRFDAVIAVHILHLVPDLNVALAEATRVLRPGGRMVAIHGEPAPPDDELSGATEALRVLRQTRSDSAAEVLVAAQALGLAIVAQHPARPRVARHSPADLAGLIGRRSWSFLWDLTDAQWQTHVEPALQALHDLPDQHRPRLQQTRMTVTALERT